MMTPNTDYEQADETDLVRRAREDGEAFGELYRRYVKKIYNYIYYRSNNHQDAEDLTARVFYRALAHIDSYTERGVPFSAWLYRIAHNLVANWHRDRGRRQILPLEDYVTDGLAGEAPEHHVESQEERDSLLAAVQNLPEDRQQLLLLKYIDHLSNAEIGAIMNRTEGAIKSLYHRTLLALRDELSRSRSRLPAEAPPDDLDPAD
ncbi:MAG: sigma-70 family RNA polymerase sigma factor [Anaerolineae bacterium]|nr:sigma-70 family RNA polymerase sigma factor [Anaerolineae bacterium]